jgi:Rieske Fe-S protein
MEQNCNGRREFLVKTTATAGGLLLGLSGLNNVSAKETEGDDVTIKLDEKSPLSKVGGSYTFDYKGDKIIVIRKTETDFAAFSAICTHKGGPLEYKEKTQQLVCPWHNSKFDTAGQPAGGPAKTPLRNFATEKAVVVNLKL